MPSLIIEITVQDPELLGNGISKRMELRGQTQVPASMLKPVSAAITLELIDDLKSARGQSKRNPNQVELFPLDSEPSRPLKPIDDAATLSAALDDTIAAWLKEDEEQTQLQKDARERAGQMIARFRAVLPNTEAVNLAMMQVLEVLQGWDAGEIIEKFPRFPEAFDDADHAAEFCKVIFGIEVDLSVPEPESETDGEGESLESIDETTGEILEDESEDPDDDDSDDGPEPDDGEDDAE